MNPRLSSDEIEAGLAYCRWLHMRSFNDWMNRQHPNLPKHQTPACFNTMGKNVYANVLAAVRASQPGAVLLAEAERKAVVKYLAKLKDASRERQTSTGVKRATLQIGSVRKFVSDGKRIVRGLATSSSTDRVGDVVEPRGGRWNLPVPMLWQHRHDQPIGWVRTATITGKGIEIEAEIAVGIGKADEVWRMIEAGLVDSFSIGFQADDWEPLPGGGKRFTSWTLLEVSVVTIPANPDARMRRGLKSNDRGIRLNGGGVRLVAAGRRR